MYLKSLYLHNFRLYKEREFLFCSGINLIEGPNAQGKTTILEAIHLLIGGRSFRTHTFKDLIKNGEKSFLIEACFEKHGIEQTLRFSFDGNERAFFHNRSPCKTLGELIGLLQGAILLPDDIQLIKGAPQRRRRYLDLQLAQMDPLYVHHLTRYYRAMHQRNHLLKNSPTRAMDVFEEEMARSAGYVIQRRREAVGVLNGECSQVQGILSDGKEAVSLSYRSRFGSEASLLDAYRNHREREMLFGLTLAGPHKDDLVLALGEQEAKTYASEGQKKSLVTALRFAEWKHLNTRCESPPLMLIDDVGVSLDRRRREKLFAFLGTFQQVFVTSTEPFELPSFAQSISLG